MIIKSKHKRELSFVAGKGKVIIINKGSNTIKDELVSLIDNGMKAAMNELGLELIENENAYTEPVKIVEVESVTPVKVKEVEEKLNVADTLAIIKDCDDLAKLNEMIEFEKLNENRATVLKALEKRVKQVTK